MTPSPRPPGLSIAVRPLRKVARARVVVQRGIRSALFRRGIEVRRVQQRAETGHYSNSGEEAIIQRWLDRLPPVTRCCVDIAAGDGVTMSNTKALLEAGWEGLALEVDPEQFARLAYEYIAHPGCRLLRARVTPENVSALLNAHEVPTDLGFLSLDIDSYDREVLDSLLDTHRPSLVCVEVNEKVPPPVRFSVVYRDDHAYRGDHFYGMSLAALAPVAERHGYAIVELEYNNAFLVPQEHAPDDLPSLDEVYRRGYLDRPDRLERMPWNRGLDAVHELDPPEAAEWVRTYFARYEGRFVCEV